MHNCPYCKRETKTQFLTTASQLLGWDAKYDEHGQLLNPQHDPNQHRDIYRCLECNAIYQRRWRYGQYSIWETEKDASEIAMYNRLAIKKFGNEERKITKEVTWNESQ